MKYNLSYINLSQKLNANDSERIKHNSQIISLIVLLLYIRYIF